MRPQGSESHGARVRGLGLAYPSPSANSVQVVQLGSRCRIASLPLPWPTARVSVYPAKATVLTRISMFRAPVGTLGKPMQLLYNCRGCVTTVVWGRRKDADGTTTLVDELVRQGHDSHQVMAVIKRLGITHSPTPRGAWTFRLGNNEVRSVCCSRQC